MRLFLIICCCWVIPVSAQTLGGNAAFNFLRLPSSALLTAAGGVNTSYQTNEVGLSASNPALLNPELNTQLHLGFNSFISGIKAYTLTGARYHEKSQSTFGGHIFFVDYGSLPQTDAAGNVAGNFRPVEYVVQVSAGRKYEERWHYGASLKFISSRYPPYHASALAFDVGVLYQDTASGVTASVLMKNMGMQLSTFSGEREDLPFDLQIGVTKRLARAPLGFSVTGQRLHRFNLLYEDQGFNADNNFEANNGFLNKTLNHLVLATHIYLGNHLEATLGYNHLRRSELNVGASGNGLNGFSMGLRVKFQKLQVLYARSQYQRNIAYNQLGITLQLNQLFGMSAL